MANENIEIWDAVKQTKYKKIFDDLHDILSSAQKDVDAAITSTLDIVCNASHSEAGTFWFYDKPGEGLIRAKAVYGGADLSNIRLTPGQGVAGQVIQTGEPRIVSNVETDKTWSSETDKKTDFKTESMICVPLTARDNTFGCIQLINKTDGSFFDDKDFELVVNLADQISKLCERYNILIEEKEYNGVAVLYVAMKEFMQGSEGTEPFELSRALKRYFELIEEPIKKHEGFVDKFDCDGILAYWIDKKANTVIEEDKDDAAKEEKNDSLIVKEVEDEPNQAVLNALLAAQEILDTKYTMQREIANKYKISFGVTAGVDVGKVYVGDIGTKTKSNHTAIGNPVNFARYLQEQADVDSIYVSEDAARSVLQKVNFVRAKNKSFLLHKKKNYDMFQVDSFKKK